MKLFLIHITKLIVAVVVISFCLQWIADRGLETLPDSKFEDWKDIFTGSINAEVVILGSSRACVNYDPVVLEEQLNKPTFNLGFNAASYNYQSKKYDWYVSYNNTPKIIIQNVDLSHFKPSVEVPDPNQFIPFLGQNEVQEFLRNNNASLQQFEKMPLVKYNSNLDFLFKGWLSFIGIKNALFTSYNGFSPVNKSYIPDTHNLKRLEEDELRMHSLSHDFYTALEYSLKQSKTSKVIFVWAPIYKDRWSLSQKKNRLYKEAIRKACDKSEHIFFLDYSNTDMNQEVAYFYDSFHLNRKGATLFSKMLGKDIKELIKD